MTLPRLVCLAYSDSDPFFTTITNTITVTTTTTTGQAGTTTITPTNITATGWVRLIGFVNHATDWTRQCVLQAGGYYSCPTITVPISTITYTVPVRRIYVTPIFNGSILWIRDNTTLMYTLTCSLAPGYACNTIPEYTVAYVIGYAGMVFEGGIRVNSPSVVRYAFEISHYVAPDFSLDQRLFPTIVELGCYYTAGGPWIGATMSRTAVTQILEADPPRFRYIIVRYEYITTFPFTLATSLQYNCFIHYYNMVQKITHIFYTATNYTTWSPAQG